jgi:uncharacterized membrane protein
MSGIYQALTTVYAMLATVPFAAFAVIWFVSYLMFREKKKTTRLAMDITTFLLIGAVSSMWNRLFDSRFGFWFILLVILIAVGLLGGYQNREKGRIDLPKIFRIVWRIGFLCLSALYILFLIMNLSAYFIKSM